MVDLFRALKLRDTEPTNQGIVERVERAMGSGDPALMEWAVNQVKKSVPQECVGSTFVPKAPLLKASLCLLLEKVAHAQLLESYCRLVFTRE
jgi:hypothetical protein